MILTLVSSPSLSVPLRTRILSKNDRVNSLAKFLGGVANAAPGQLSMAVTPQIKIVPVAANNQLRALALIWVSSRSVSLGAGTPGNRPARSCQRCKQPGVARAFLPVATPSSAIVVQHARRRPRNAGNGAEIFVDGLQLVLRHVPQPWPGHDLQQIPVEGEAGRVAGRARRNRRV